MEMQGSEVFENYLRQLHRDMKDPDTIYETVSVLVLSEEQKERAFESWGKENASAQFAAEVTNTDFELEGEQKIEKLWGVYENFLKGGEQYTSLLEGGESNEKSLWNKTLSAINLENTDYYVFASKCYPSLEQYFNMFLDDVDIVLDEDLSFPLSLPLTELLEYTDKTEKNTNNLF